MRIVCLAYQSVGYMGLRYFLEETEDQVVAVFTHQDAPGERVWWSSVAELAERHDVPVFTPEDINQPTWVERLRDLQPDFLFSLYYRTLVKPPILKIPPGGCLNLHGSLLPKYRGRAPVNWALVNGETETGITLHYMVPRADAGDIVAQAVVPIATDDQISHVYAKLLEAGLRVLRTAWPLLKTGKAPRIPQDESQATVVGRRTPEDGRFEWSWHALQIHNLVRAVAEPYPGAFVDTPKGRLFVWRTRPTIGLVFPDAPQPGTVVRADEHALEVATGRGQIALEQVQLDDEEKMSGPQFAQRHGLNPGDRL